MPVAKTKQPLTTEERKLLYIYMQEAQARGINLPKEATTLFQKKELKWPVAPNGYFIRRDGHFYNPSPNHEGFIKSQAPFALLYGPRGCGKALSITTPIPTPWGWTTMGSIEVGDLVFDEQGLPTKVIATSEIMRNHKCYEVEFDDGSILVADADHEWTTLTAYDRSNKDSVGKFRMKRGKIVPRTSPPWKYRTFTTHEIKNSITWCERGDVNHSVDVSMPLNLPDDDLPVPPYVLGLWLGDGRSSGSNITIGDEDIRNQERILSEWGIFLKCYGNIQYGMTINGESSVFRNSKGQMESNPKSLYSLLRSLELLDNKHIPNDYLRASYQQRLELIQGLMDSDGTIRPDGACEFCTTSVELASGFYELCMTLGIKVTCKSGNVKFGGRSFPRFRFVFVPYIPVFRLDRKVIRIKQRGSQSNRRFRRYIIDVRETDSVPVKCITVDSPNHLYLAGMSFIPTHNSGAGSQKALLKIMQGESGIIQNPDFENLKISTWPEFRDWIPWTMVVPRQQHRQNPDWEPTRPFKMVFRNGAVVYIKGGKEAGSSRGPNVNWFWYDEAGRDDTGISWKTTSAGVRVGHNPQRWATMTPRPTEHWSYQFFVRKNIPPDVIELFEKLGLGDKILIDVFHATREDNAANLDDFYYANLSMDYPSGWMRKQEFEGEFANEGGKLGSSIWFTGGRDLEVDDDKSEPHPRRILDEAPETVIKKVRFWDLAGTEKKVAKDDPDETVGTLVSAFKFERDNNWCIEHQVGGWWGWDGLLEAIANTARHDGPYVTVVIEEEPGSGGKNQIAAIQKHFKGIDELKSHKVVGQRARDVGDRVMAANHWFALAAGGKMWIVKGSWNQKFLGQLDGFTQLAHDDYVTSVTGAMSHIKPYKAWAKVPFMSI